MEQRSGTESSSFAARRRHAHCARPEPLMRRACSRAVDNARSLDVCLDSTGPFIEASRRPGVVKVVRLVSTTWRASCAAMARSRMWGSVRVSRRRDLRVFVSFLNFVFQARTQIDRQHFPASRRPGVVEVVRSLRSTLAPPALRASAAQPASRRYPRSAVSRPRLRDRRRPSDGSPPRSSAYPAAGAALDTLLR